MIRIAFASTNDRVVPQRRLCFAASRFLQRGHNGRCLSSSSSNNNDVIINELPPPSISKVLIANRGEIACRVIRTCRRFNIPTVALYSVADGPNSLHARMANEAYLIGSGPAPIDSYLLQDEILQIAKDTGTQAIHPGYGFLSENASFVDNIQKSGIQFIGPPLKAISAMGSKSESKSIMDAAGVPTTPGYYERDNKSKQDPELLYQKAVQEIGLPVLIKAVMGGGGKGMRLVWRESEFKEMLKSCQREAMAAFGDEYVLLEKYLVRPRHVEVQVVADQHGNVVSLHERDCSLQRRHQKIIEEAPASDLSTEIRQRLGEMGRQAAKAVGYENAGTVEFLLDTNNPEKFYFCEMNTRLQVEHPITEAITGIDLVEWQLRVTAGEVLPITDSLAIPRHGHAFEARIYAENPKRNFLPATGNVWFHRPPAPLNAMTTAGRHVNQQTGPQGIRVDSCIQEGQDISVYYDPMISKLIVHDNNRDLALTKLIKALKEYKIAGLATNIDFLIACAQHPTFAKAGAINTGFLDDYANDVFPNSSSSNEDDDDAAPSSHVSPPPPLAQAVGAFVAMSYLENRLGQAQGRPSPSQSSSSSSPLSPWSSQHGSWRLGGERCRAKRVLQVASYDSSSASDISSHYCSPVECISGRDGSFDIIIPIMDNSATATPASSASAAIAKESFHVAAATNSSDNTGNGGGLQVIVNGTLRITLAAVAIRENDHGILEVCMWPENLKDHYAWQVNIQNPWSSGDAALLEGDSDGIATGGSKSGKVKAPMPGKISRVHFQVGDSVQQGDVVLVMEAMKMEHAIKAPISGVIQEIRHEKPNEIVADGATLFVVQAPTAQDTEAKMVVEE